MRFGWKILFKLPLAALAVGVMGSAVMWLWNWVVPPLIAGAHLLDFWHALGLLVLCRILFGGFHGKGGWHRRHHRHGWHALSRDERSRFGKEEQK